MVNVHPFLIKFMGLILPSVHLVPPRCENSIGTGSTLRHLDLETGVDRLGRKGLPAPFGLHHHITNKAVRPIWNPTTTGLSLLALQLWKSTLL